MAAGGQLTHTEWIARHTTGAPPALGERARHYAGTIVAGLPLPAALAAAATAALEAVARQPEGRGAALDLLAADALITLALLAQAETDPSRLREFAARILHAEVARA